MSRAAHAVCAAARLSASRHAAPCSLLAPRRPASSAEACAAQASRCGVAVTRLRPLWRWTEDGSPAGGSRHGCGGGGPTAAWPRQPSRRRGEQLGPLGARRSAAALVGDTGSGAGPAASGWLQAFASGCRRAAASPVLSEPGRYHLFAPPAAEERAADPRCATAEAVELEMWLEGGYLHVLAAPLPFAQALPVHASDLHGPGLSSLLRAWQEARAERWSAFERYMLDAVQARGVPGSAAHAPGPAQEVVHFDAKGTRLNHAWQVGRSGERWRFELARR